MTIQPVLAPDHPRGFQSAQTRCRRAALGLMVVLAASVSGCANDRQEVENWMESVRAGTRPVREKISEPKRFEPFRYERAGSVDPFSHDRLSAEILQAMAGPAAGGLRPDPDRPREPLEAYPLDTIRMVGHLSDGRQNYALLQVDTMVYQVAVGNRAGQNDGLITLVAESEVKLREVVQDPAGAWVHREASLQLRGGGR
jgi:type IV pilus assembly protein PilP